MAEKTPEKPQGLTKSDAAKLVSRPVPVIGEDGKPTGKTKDQPISEKEVLSFKDYGDRVVVVTTDGQKFEGAKK